MKKLLTLSIVIFLLAAYLGVKFFWRIPSNVPIALSGKVWPTESIDTVKYSRDLAREKLKDQAFDIEIEKQILSIAETGATHVAIATPYDEEFVPYLRRWVETARRHSLHVWFRGNLSGWEKWFNYPEIDREDHTKNTLLFIEKHSDLFEDGDIFTSCPECENGGTGDPRKTGDVDGFRKFLIDENNKVKLVFSKIHKNVVSGYYSMNGDVAKLIMDEDTTRALGGVATIDHYVSSPEKLIEYVDELAETSKGKIVLGEWGVPIPDINGSMTEEEQSKWITEALSMIAANKNIVGLNYWTNKGGSTALWNDNGSKRAAVDVLKGFYTPKEVSGVVLNEVGNAIYSAIVATSENISTTDYAGRFRIEVLPDNKKLEVQAAGYINQTITINDGNFYTVTLKKETENFFFRFAKWLHQRFKP